MEILSISQRLHNINMSSSTVHTGLVSSFLERVLFPVKLQKEPDTELLLRHGSLHRVGCPKLNSVGMAAAAFNTLHGGELVRGCDRRVLVEAV